MVLGGPTQHRGVDDGHAPGPAPPGARDRAGDLGAQVAANEDLVGPGPPDREAHGLPAPQPVELPGVVIQGGDAVGPGPGGRHGGRACS